MGAVFGSARKRGRTPAAAYDRGGREPTVTDALVVGGIIDPENFFGGNYRLDADPRHARSTTESRNRST